MTNPNALTAVLKTMPKDTGEVVFSDGLHDPYPAHLKALLGQREASQL
jgi:hypothetical protein